MASTPTTRMLSLALSMSDGSALDSFDERVEAFAVASRNAALDGIETVADAADVTFADLEALMVRPRCDRGLSVWRQSGLLALLLPEVAALDMDHRGAHKDNLAHTFLVAAQAPAHDRGRVRIAALFHDVGKPSTRRFVDGKVTFHHHEHVGRNLTVRRLVALGADRSLATDIGELVAMSGRSGGFLDQAWTDSAVRRLATDAGPLLDDLLMLVAADTTSRHSSTRERVTAEISMLRSQLDRVEALDAKRALRPALNGDQIMAAFGLAPGRQVGVLYRHLLTFAERGVELSKSEAIAELRALLGT